MVEGITQTRFSFWGWRDMDTAMGNALSIWKWYKRITGKTYTGHSDVLACAERLKPYFNGALKKGDDTKKEFVKMLMGELRAKAARLSADRRRMKKMKLATAGAKKPA